MLFLHMQVSMETIFSHIAYILPYYQIPYSLINTHNYMQLVLAHIWLMAYINMLITSFYFIHFTLTHSLTTDELHVNKYCCISCLQLDIKKYALPEVCPEMTCTYLLHNTSTSARTSHDGDSFPKTLQLSVCFLCLCTDGSSRTEGLMGVSL